MAYNNGFPMTYPQLYPQYQQPYQIPQYQQPVQQVQQPAQPSSRMAEVFPAANEKAVLEFPCTAGTTVMFVANDESFVAVKEVSVTGQVSVLFFDKRPPKPSETPIDMTLYVTREELESRLAALSAPAKRQVKKETEVET